MRDPVADPLLTPQNSAFLVIDYQPSQIQAVTSIDHDLLTRNIVSVARLAKTYGLPVVLSTVNVAANGQPPTIPELKRVLSDSVEIDRTQINSWEDIDFRLAVEATGRKKLIMAALWTEVCLAFPALDALRQGYEVFPVVDAVHLPGGAQGGAGTHRPGRRAAHRLGIPGLRIATRLGPNRHCSRGSRHRAHFSTQQRALIP
jgi:isochorismate hydrolase